MEQPSQFRSAFNGFNREDVVRYMEFLNSKHASQMAQLTNELEYLRGKQETQDAGRVSQMEQDLAAAQRENETLRQRVAELEKKLSAQPAAPAAHQSELEAYRRAERVERTAKERASHLVQQTAGVLDSAAAQVEASAGQIDAVSGQLSSLLSQLQSTMDSARRTVREAVDSMQSTADSAK